MGYAPLLGENNREILSRNLGYGDEAIDQLFAEGVLYKKAAVHKLPVEFKRLKEQQQTRIGIFKRLHLPLTFLLSFPKKKSIFKYL